MYGPWGKRQNTHHTQTSTPFLIDTAEVVPASMQIQNAAHSVHIFVISSVGTVLYVLVRRRRIRRCVCSSRPGLLLVPFLRLLIILLGRNPLPIDTGDGVSGGSRSMYMQAYPLMPRTCHHLTPPTRRFATSGPPSAAIRYGAASSQLDIGTSTRTTCVHGGDGVRVLEKPAGFRYL